MPCAGLGKSGSSSLADAAKPPEMMEPEKAQRLHGRSRRQSVHLPSVASLFLIKGCLTKACCKFLGSGDAQLQSLSSPPNRHLPQLCEELEPANTRCFEGWWTPMDVWPAASDSGSLLKPQETKGSSGDNGFAFAVLPRGSCAGRFTRVALLK